MKLQILFFTAILLISLTYALSNNNKLKSHLKLNRKNNVKHTKISKSQTTTKISNKESPMTPENEVNQPELPVLDIHQHQQDKYLEHMQNNLKFISHFYQGQDSEGCSLDFNDGKWKACAQRFEFEAVFPDTHVDEERTLEKFTKKIVYVRNDMLTVYTSTDTMEDGGANYKNFLGEFGLFNFKLLCNQKTEICTVKEFRNELYSQSGLTFKPNPKVSSKFGPSYESNCLILVKTAVEETQNSIYLCSKDLIQVKAFKWYLSALIPLIQERQIVKKAEMLNDSQDGFKDVYIHFFKHFIQVDTEPQSLDFENQLNVVVNTPHIVKWDSKKNCELPGSSMTHEQVSMPWKGDEDKKPDPKRCFMLPETNEEKGFVREYELKPKEHYFCVLKQEDGTDYILGKAFLQANQILGHFNNQYRDQKQDDCLKAIHTSRDVGSYYSKAFLYAMFHSFQISMTQDCKEVYPKGEGCEQIVQDSEREYLKWNICKGDEECLKLVLEFIPPKGKHPNELNNPWLMQNFPMDAENQKDLLNDFFKIVNTHRDLAEDDKGQGETAKAAVVINPQETKAEPVKKEVLSKCDGDGGYSVKFRLQLLPLFDENDPWLSFQDKLTSNSA